MKPPAKLLDTSTLSDIMRGIDTRVASKALEYLDTHPCFTFSIMTRYEILRGLQARRAEAQIERFEERCGESEVLPLSDKVVVEGAKIYADLRRRGLLIDDADILIAATARVEGLVMVTENPAHFERVPGIAIESWRESFD